MAFVQSEFLKAFEELEALATSEGLGEVTINQCELIYVNPLPVSVTGVPVTEPHRIFRVWSDDCGEEWQEFRRTLVLTFDTGSTAKTAILLVALQRHWRPFGHKMGQRPSSLR